MKWFPLLLILLTTPIGGLWSAESARVTYIANSGLLVEDGETRILFDPLFRYPHDYYQRVPADMEASIIAGEGAFAGVDAVFISHFHLDHFSPELILSLLRQQPDLVLVAPGQAISAMYREAENADDGLFTRVRSVNIARGEPPQRLSLENIEVEVVMIPHSGWPRSNQNVENLSYRVTLNGQSTVVHMGDADTRYSHFEAHSAHWSARHAHAAFPPYWFFLSGQGRRALDELVQPDLAVGVHIPAESSRRPPELSGFEVFDTPGESRLIGPAKDQR